MGKITIQYYTIDFDKVDEDHLTGLDPLGVYEYLQDYYVTNEVKFDKGVEMIDLHQEAIFDIDLTQMKDFPNLKDLVLGYNAFIFLDLSGLASCGKLEELLFDRCGLVEIDISPLEKCKNFRLLTFRGNLLEKLNLSAFRNHPKVEWLEFPHNGISQIDLSPLGTCPLSSSRP